MSVQYPTTVSSIMAGLPNSNYAPVPYRNDEADVYYEKPGGYAVDPKYLSGLNSPAIAETTKPQINPLQQWLQSKFPNTYAGAGMDVDRVAEGANEILDKGAASWDKMSFGERGSAILGGAQSVYNMYNSYKQGKLAEDQFKFTKDSFNRNFDAAAKTTNSALADRQATRVARDPTAYASVNDYMKKYGV